MSETQDQPPRLESPPISYEEMMASIIDYDEYKIVFQGLKEENVKKKKTNIEELQRQAYSKVLHAFRAQCRAMTKERVMIIADLKKVLKISSDTHFELDDIIKTDPLVQRWGKVPKATNTEERYPVNNEFGIAPQDEMAEPSSTSEESFVPSWGQVSPKSLVGRLVNIRMPGEEEYMAFQIKGYNEETEMHHLVTAQSQRTYIDPLDWIDIRHIPAEDMVWQDGHPRLPARKISLKPGETILCTTSTSHDKTRIIEVGKSANGIPIIRKLDRGKAIAA